jgi:hypothetical protein
LAAYKISLLHYTESATFITMVHTLRRQLMGIGDVLLRFCQIHPHSGETEQVGPVPGIIDVLGPGQTLKGFGAEFCS